MGKMYGLGGSSGEMYTILEESSIWLVLQILQEYVGRTFTYREGATMTAVVLRI